MSRNGSGVYSLPPGSTVTNGDTSDASDVNTPLQDIAQDLNTARPIVAGGTGATSASGARTALAVPGLGANDTITGDWTISGDWTFTGAVTLPAGGIGTADLANDAVTLAKVADAALSGADATLVTGTAGTAGNLVQWNADGDAVGGPDVLDEDDMASDSAAAVPTQQSVKAYVDSLAATSSETSPIILSGAAPINASTSIPSGVNTVIVMLRQVSTSGANDLLVQLSAGGVFVTTGYQSSTSINLTSTIGFLLELRDAPGSLDGSLRFDRVPGGNRWIASYAYRDGTYGRAGGGSISLSGALDGIRINVTGSDTFDAGDVSLRYYS